MFDVGLKDIRAMKHKMYNVGQTNINLKTLGTCLKCLNCIKFLFQNQQSSIFNLNFLTM